MLIISSAESNPFTTSVTLSVPLKWSLLVITISKSKSDKTCFASLESIARITFSKSFDCIALSATCTTIGLPSMSANIFLGNLFEPILAGIMPTIILLSSFKKIKLQIMCYHLIQNIIVNNLYI